MKSVVLLLAVIVGCLAYELDRAWTLSAEGPSTVGTSDLTGATPRSAELWMPLDARSGGALFPTPSQAASAPGQEESPYSTRLRGPGVSRKHQTRL